MMEPKRQEQAPPNSPKDFSEFSMLDLFRMEVDTQLEVLNKGLLELERESF